MDQLREKLKQLIRKELEEMSGTSGGEAYSTPRAFAPKGQKKNAATKYAEKEGWKVTKGETHMPSDSKVRDYKSLWSSSKKKTYKMYKESTNTSDISKIKDKLTLYSKDELPGAQFYNAIKSISISDTNLKEKVKELLKNYSTSKALYDDLKDLLSDKSMKENKTNLKNIIKEELLNEVTYSKFKNEVKFRTKSEQLHKAIREVKRKLQEIDRIVEYTSRMKQELSEDGGLNYWKATQKNIGTISEMVNQLNNKIKNLHQ